MQKTGLTFLFLVLYHFSFSQNNFIKKDAVGTTPDQKKETIKSQAFVAGPVPYRRLIETIGENYLVLPLDSSLRKRGYWTLKKKGDAYNHLSSIEGEGKILKLLNIIDKIAILKDTVGIEYTCDMVSNQIPYMTPLSDIIQAHKMYSGKTLWINHANINTGKPYNVMVRGKLDDVKFEPILVTDVIAGPLNDFPIIFTIKNQQGKSGFVFVNISGTNTELDKSIFFKTLFFTEDPKLKYKLTPVLWQKVKNGEIEIGMPSDAVFLIEGTPNDKNITTSAKNKEEQWVYGEGASQHYFYFTNGKLTSWSN